MGNEEEEEEEEEKKTPEAFIHRMHIHRMHEHLRHRRIENRHGQQNQLSEDPKNYSRMHRQNSLFI